MNTAPFKRSFREFFEVTNEPISAALLVLADAITEAVDSEEIAKAIDGVSRTIVEDLPQTIRDGVYGDGLSGDHGLSDVVANGITWAREAFVEDPTDNLT